MSVTHLLNLRQPTSVPALGVWKLPQFCTFLNQATLPKNTSLCQGPCLFSTAHPPTGLNVFPSMTPPDTKTQTLEVVSEFSSTAHEPRSLAIDRLPRPPGCTWVPAWEPHSGRKGTVPFSGADQATRCWACSCAFLPARVQTGPGLCQ